MADIYFTYLSWFAKLPKIDSVMTGPDLGRSMATYYCLVAQSAAQIGKIYSKEDQEIIYATTAVKFILQQKRLLLSSASSILGRF